MLIYVKLVKKWGEAKVGDTIAVDERKGRILIAKGFCVEVKAPEKKPAAPAPTPIENMMANPVGETTTTGPQQGKRGPGRPPKTKTEDTASA